MKKFGLQIFSVRDHMVDEQSVKDAFLELAKMGYSYAHTAGTYDFIAPEKFYEYANATGIEICGTHYDWNRIVNDVEGTVAYHKALGTNIVGIGSMPGPPREDEEELDKFIALFNETARKYAPYGMKLTYHHHSFEFKKLSDGRSTLFDKLVEGFTEPNISFVLDTYWLQHGGKDVRATIEQLAGRVDILHLKDMEAMKRYTVAGTNAAFFGPAITEIGSGNINFKDIIPLAEKCGAKYFVVEDDRAPEVGSYDAVRRSADYIKAELLEK